MTSQAPAITAQFDVLARDLTAALLPEDVRFVCVPVITPDPGPPPVVARRLRDAVLAAYRAPRRGWLRRKASA